MRERGEREKAGQCACMGWRGEEGRGRIKEKRFVLGAEGSVSEKMEAKGTKEVQR